MLHLFSFFTSNSGVVYNLPFVNSVSQPKFVCFMAHCSVDEDDDDNRSNGLDINVMYIRSAVYVSLVQLFLRPLVCELWKVRSEQDCSCFDCSRAHKVDSRLTKCLMETAEIKVNAQVLMFTLLLFLVMYH